MNTMIINSQKRRKVKGKIKQLMYFISIFSLVFLMMGNVYAVDNKQSSSKVKQIAAGRNHTVVLKEDGTVWALGENKFGQLGEGIGTYEEKPVKVKGLN